MSFRIEVYKESEKLRPKIIWFEENDILYEDLHPNLFQASLNYIENFYIPANFLTNCLKTSQDDLKYYVNRMLLILKDETSIVAVHKSTRNICGISVCQIMPFEDFAWVNWHMLMLFENSITSRILDLHYHIQFKGKLEKQYPKSNSLHIFLLYGEDMEISKNLLNQAEEQAKSLKCELLTYVGTCRAEQEIAKACGMQEQYVLNYDTYLGNENSEKLPRKEIGQNSAILFVKTFNYSET